MSYQNYNIANLLIYYGADETKINELDTKINQMVNELTEILNQHANAIKELSKK